jgi:hypothetical protein
MDGPDFVDWLALERSDGREFDMGLHRHWLDPTRPFASTVLNGAHGVMLTSATLRDRSDAGDDWDTALARSGAAHLDSPTKTAAFDSPFDYANQAEVLIVNDVPRGDIPALAAAYGRLIEASGGGVLGLLPRSAACAPSTAASPTGWRAAACRSTPSMSIPSTPARWSTSSATIPRPACWAPMPCVTGWTCPATRCASW